MTKRLESFTARVVNAGAILTFEGRTLVELKQAFVDTIADYLDCIERGVEPEKPYCDVLPLVSQPEPHRRIAGRAATAGESIDQFIAKRLEAVA